MQFLLLCSSELYSVSCRIMFIYIYIYIYIYILVSGAVVPDILISVLIIYMYQVSRKVENNTCSFTQK